MVFPVDSSAFPKIPFALQGFDYCALLRCFLLCGVVLPWCTGFLLMRGLPLVACLKAWSMQLNSLFCHCQKTVKFDMTRVPLIP